MNKGGQREIVRHGTDGFLCETLEDMARHTRTLAETPLLLSRMSASAKARAQLYSRKSFDDRLGHLLDRINR
jgi:glycosyltransferase involved in cell wall biosynthesis